jgi:predicted DNA-binding transcriptional regulator YafY
VLLEAIRSRRAVTFTYRKPRAAEGDARNVQPWGVVSRRGHWYLVGHDIDRAEPRVFRLSRIAGTAVAYGSEQAFDIPNGIDVAAMIAAATPEDITTALIQIDPGAAVSLRRRALNVSNDVAEISYGDEDAFASELVGYADSVVVLAPESLRATVVARLRQCIAAQARS